MKMKEIGSAVELCSGMGAMGIGAAALGFSIQRAYDSWQPAVDVFNFNVASSTPIALECDLVTAAGYRQVVADKKRVGALDLLLAGPPCKGFSQLKNGFHDGRMSHNRSNNSVLKAIPHYVEFLRPRFLVVENVPALLAHREGRTFRRLIKHLTDPTRRLAYRVQWAVYDSAQYGTPQSRKRLIIFGVRRDCDQGQTMPEAGPNLRPLFTAMRQGREIPKEFDMLFDELQNPSSLKLVSAAQALSDLPTLDSGQSDSPRKYRTRPESAYQRWAREEAGPWVFDTQTPGINQSTSMRLRHVPPGGCAADIPVKHLDGLSRKFGSAYRRLHPDAPSMSLSTKYDCVYHYDAARSLSIREYCRLQGIPDRIRLPKELVSRRSAYEMIGNSVPPRLIESVLGATLASARRSSTSRTANGGKRVESDRGAVSI